MEAITRDQAEQIKDSKYPRCPKCGRPTTVRSMAIVVDSLDGLKEDSYVARCSGLYGITALLQALGFADGTETETGHLSVRLGPRVKG